MRLAASARLAIEVFAGTGADLAALERMVAEQAVEFMAVHAADPWFARQPSHTFTALQHVPAGAAIPDRQLVLVVVRQPVTLSVAALDLPADYHVARVIREAQLLNVNS